MSRLVFMGTPPFAVPVLGALAEAGHTIVAVYTRAPKPAGRGKALRRSPVHEAAEKHGVPVFTPASLRTSETAATFRDHEADCAVVVAYGLILPQPILDAPRLGCLNLHGSLLPRWRGAAPIQRAVMAGDAETGVMAMRMEAGLDTGPVGMSARTPIGPDETAGDLHDRLAVLGAGLMPRAVAALIEGGLVFAPQSEAGVTYAAKIDKAEAEVDWTRPAQALHDHIRGLSPFPGATTMIAGERVKLLRTTLAAGAGQPGQVLDGALTIACREGAIRLVAVQRAGGRPMAAAEFLRGLPVPAGTRLA